METLYSSACSVISTYINSLKIDKRRKWVEELMSLPAVILEDLLCYFCPATLIVFQDNFEKSEINTNAIWKYHYDRLCRYHCRRKPKFFYSFQTDWENDFYRKFMEKLFHSSILETKYEPLPRGIKSELSPRVISDMFMSVNQHKKHDIETVKIQIPPKIANEFTDLKLYIGFVSSLSVDANQCEQLPKESEFMDSFRKTVHRLDVHSLKAENFSHVTNFVSQLLHDGCLEELNLYAPQLDNKFYHALYHICAGHTDMKLKFGLGRNLAPESDDCKTYTGGRQFLCCERQESYPISDGNCDSSFLEINSEDLTNEPTPQNDESDLESSSQYEDKTVKSSTRYDEINHDESTSSLYDSALQGLQECGSLSGK